MKRVLMRKPARKMAGLTLLETMFGIAIGALIIIAAILFYKSTQNGQNVNRAVSDINTIYAQAENYIAPGATALTALAATATCTTGSNAICTLQAAGYLPTTLTDPWGNVYDATVTVNPAGVNKGSPGTIAISPTSLSADDPNCNAIATAVQGTQTGDVKGSGGATETGTCAITLNL